jgi:hypothetical protein
VTTAHERIAAIRGFGGAADGNRRLCGRFEAFRHAHVVVEKISKSRFCNNRRCTKPTKSTPSRLCLSFFFVLLLLFVTCFACSLLFAFFCVCLCAPPHHLITPIPHMHHIAYSNMARGCGCGCGFPSQRPGGGRRAATLAAGGRRAACGHIIRLKSAVAAAAAVVAVRCALCVACSLLVAIDICIWHMAC